MSLGAGRFAQRLCVCAVALTGIACSSAGTPVAVPSERAAATSASAESSASDELAPAGTTSGELPLTTVAFEVTASNLAVHHDATGSAVKADMHARALQSMDELRFEYCGPPLTFLSVDGSTVEATVEGRVLRAPLYSPLRPEDEFSFRFMTTVSRHGVADHRAVAEIAAALLCR